MVSAETPAAGGAAGIAARLRAAILDGAYPRGQRLPAERDLARRFSAARATVREALRQLQAEGLVRRRAGSGTYAAYEAGLSRETIAELTSPLELIEVRRAVEPHIVRLAILHATARDLERLGAALAELEACDGDRERFSAADETFHLALAESTRNPLMVWVYRQINDVRAHRQWAAMKRVALNEAEIAAYNRQHRALWEALRARDIETAERIMTEHLDKARNALLGAGPRASA